MKNVETTSAVVGDGADVDVDALMEQLEQRMPDPIEQRRPDPPSRDDLLLLQQESDIRVDVDIDEEISSRERDNDPSLSEQDIDVESPGPDRDNDPSLTEQDEALARQMQEEELKPFYQNLDSKKKMREKESDRATVVMPGAVLATDAYKSAASPSVLNARQQHKGRKYVSDPLFESNIQVSAEEDATDTTGMDGSGEGPPPSPRPTPVVVADLVADDPSSLTPNTHRPINPDVQIAILSDAQLLTPAHKRLLRYMVVGSVLIVCVCVAVVVAVMLKKDSNSKVGGAIVMPDIAFTTAPTFSSSSSLQDSENGSNWNDETTQENSPSPSTPTIDQTSLATLNPSSVNFLGTSIAPSESPPTEEPTGITTNDTTNPTTFMPTNPPTEIPKTLTPTTRESTTASPTTISRTTVSPTTEAPTSASPTTASPKTVSPTTTNPTTGGPTTPTTSSPTTGSPTTLSPTTEAPTSANPTTDSPTTPSPTTKTPSSSPTRSPTKAPTPSPTTTPTNTPTPSPTKPPTASPTTTPTSTPTRSPTKPPTPTPTTRPPSPHPTNSPTKKPDVFFPLDPNAGRDGEPESAFPLQVCQADCDEDGDCADGLVCLQRSEPQDSIPDYCAGEPQGSEDYCVLQGPPTPKPTLGPTRQLECDGEELQFEMIDDEDNNDYSEQWLYATTDTVRVRDGVKTTWNRCGELLQDMSTKQCLTVFCCGDETTSRQEDVKLAPCDPDNRRQKWELKKIQNVGTVYHTGTINGVQTSYVSSGPGGYYYQIFNDREDCCIGVDVLHGMTSGSGQDIDCLHDCDTSDIHQLWTLHD